MVIKWCDSCKKEIQPIKKFNWPIFIVLLICTGVLWIVYLIYYWVKSPDTCPICNQSAFLRPMHPGDTGPSQYIPQQQYAPQQQYIPQQQYAPQQQSITQKKFCPNCGNPVTGDLLYCPQCGSKVQI